MGSNVIRYFKFSVPKQECQQNNPCEQLDDIKLKNISILTIPDLYGKREIYAIKSSTSPPTNGGMDIPPYNTIFLSGTASANKPLYFKHKLKLIYNDGTNLELIIGSIIFKTNDNGDFRLLYTPSIGAVSPPVFISPEFPCDYYTNIKTTEPVKRAELYIDIDYCLQCKEQPVMFISPLLSMEGY